MSQTPDQQAQTATPKPSYYDYDPSLAAAILFCVLFSLTTLLHLYQMLRTRTWYFIPFCVGGAFQVVGYACRAVNAEQTPDWERAFYIVQTLGPLLAPALYAASIYMELGRIMILVSSEHLSLIRRSWMTKIFVCGDILSFAVQGIGGGMVVSGDTDKVEKGQDIVIGGLWIQIVFFGLFVLNSVIYTLRLRRRPTEFSKELPWTKHIIVLWSVSLLILVRSIYRVVEFAEGKGGELMSHEIYMYILDSTLMFLSMLPHNVYHASEVKSLYKGGKVAFLTKIYTVEGRKDLSEYDMLSRSEREQHERLASGSNVA
ncbi:RTA1 like protein-domain-containing protein [Lineolata rhizophorae]|uniref:RTA1 like protein-domain-containing protein n=1 Tax=Lineolata rhizophorae TaxID=578093 RepID=A0A6A6NRU7_9PEZI|nr:RTA1 like protein-domain-containing protein [Lineolata rhizophorae]